MQSNLFFTDSIKVALEIGLIQKSDILLLMVVKIEANSSEPKTKSK